MTPRFPHTCYTGAKAISSFTLVFLVRPRQVAQENIGIRPPYVSLNRIAYPPARRDMECAV